MSQGEKLSKSDPFQILIRTPIHFGPLKFQYILAVKTHGIQNVYKIVGNKSKTNSELQFEFYFSKTWVREKQNLS